MAAPLRFHWISYPDWSPRDSAQFIRICHEAEAAGLDSVHIPVQDSLESALALVTDAAARTSTVRFRFGCDARRISPAVLARQMADAASHLAKRLIVHLVLESVDSFALAAEFLSTFRELFGQSEMPDVHVQGESADAAVFAIKHAECLWRRPARPDQVHADALPVLHFGKEVGILSPVIARAAREDAVEAAGLLLRSTSAGSNDDGAWITPNLWLANATAGSARRTVIAGSFEETAGMLHTFRRRGISQFGFVGSPDGQEFSYFATHVLPLVRALHSTG